MALFDQLSSMFGGAAVPGSMAQKIGLMGSPLIAALLAKHGHAPPPEAGADAGAAVADVADPKVGPDLGDPAAKAANVLGGLGSFGDGGSINDALPGADTGKDSIFGAAGMDPIKAALGANAAKPRGFLDRIGDFIHSDEGRAALLRSGAATLQGGLGAGIQAGANFVDQRRHERAAGAAEDRKFGIEERRADSEDAWRLGQLDNQTEQNFEAHRANVSREGLEGRRIGLGYHQHDTPTGGDRLNFQSGREQRSLEQWKTYIADANSDADRSERMREFNTQMGWDQTKFYNPQPTPPQPGTVTTTNVTETPEHSEGGFLGFGRTTVPGSKRTVETKTPVRPSEVKPGGGATQISSDAEYNALPSGARFVGPDGQVRIKP